MTRKGIDFVIDGGMLLIAGIVILAASVACRGDEIEPVPDPISIDDIILPTDGSVQPTPDPVPQPQPSPDVSPVVLTTLNAGEMYVIRFKGKPWRVVDSRQGVVLIHPTTGPRDFHGKFADAKDRTKDIDRTFIEPNLHVVTAVTSGQVELICIPPDDRPNLRVMLTVAGPRPPPEPGPVLTDVLAECHRADRKSQIEILRALVGKNLPRDAAGLMTAKEFVNAERIRRRTEDWIPYTDAVAEAMFDGTVAELADKLEVRP